MKVGWLILILSILSLTVRSQSSKCYQTVQVSCGDTIVEYLNAKEKRNLFKLQVKFEQLKAEVEYLREVGKLDSSQIVNLNKDFDALKYQFEQSKFASGYYKDAYEKIYSANKRLTKQIKLIRIKNALGGTLGVVGSFGAGVGITFLILKYSK